MAIIKRKIIHSESPRHCMFEYVYFANPGSVIDGLSVYKSRQKLGEHLAKQIKELNLSIDYIVPVPDTSRIVAQAISESLNIPLREAIIKNRTILRTFIMPDPKEREQTALMKYQFIREFIEGKTLAVVDDSIVRGLTSKRIISQLRSLGARTIIFVSSCPPQRYSCYYGVDFPTRPELIAYNRTIEDIKLEIGSDYLIYQTLEGLYDTLQQIGGICDACITGNYPTQHAQTISSLVDKGVIPETEIAYEYQSDKND